MYGTMANLLPEPEKEDNMKQASPNTQASSSQGNSPTGGDCDDDSVFVVALNNIEDSNTTTEPAALVLNDVSERLELLQTEIEALKQRNFEKDRGKEFESSYTRVIFIMVITYWTLFGYMCIIQTSNPFLDAIVPTVGFNISTWSLPFVKEWWIQVNHYYRHGESESTSIRRCREEEAARRPPSINV